MSKKDGFAAWRQDGDDERMRRFFQRAELTPEITDRIKQLTRQKAASMQEKERLGLLNPDPSRAHPGAIRTRVGNLRWRFHLKWAIPALCSCLVLAVVFASQAWPDRDAQQDAAFGYDPAIGSAERGLSDGRFNLSSDTGTSLVEALSSAPLAPQQYKAARNTAADLQTETAVRQVVYNLNATLYVQDIAQAIQRITDQTQALGGYVLHVSQRNDEKETPAYGSINVRVPAAQLSALREQLAQWGTVLDQELSGNDITETYLDVQTRLNHWQAEESRYLEILHQANTVEDMLRIEDSLARARLEMEQLQAQINSWNEQIAYSSVGLSLYTEKSVLGAIRQPWQPLKFTDSLHTARQALLKSVSAIWNAFNYLIVGIGYALPAGVLIVMLGGGFYLWRRHIPGGRSKK
ncbi:MAG: DUF4349 domain-containing protein [Peptococcaceae bacterium]|jgi:hypothetical protein|nr:DUF4349 domain-containing protein [Peptococcaceae bacterium]